MNILASALMQVGTGQASKIIEDFINKNELLTKCVAWDYIPNQKVFILKMNLWFDKSTGILSSVYLDDKVNNKHFYTYEHEVTIQGGLEAQLDYSDNIPVLKNFNHYIEEIISIPLENPRAISFVFVDVNENFKELDLVFELGNKKKSISIKTLLEEVPTILQFADQRGVGDYIEDLKSFYLD